MDGDDELGHRTYFSDQLVGTKLGDHQRHCFIRFRTATSCEMPFVSVNKTPQGSIMEL
jgi:hypothetical protein